MSFNPFATKAVKELALPAPPAAPIAADEQTATSNLVVPNAPTGPIAAPTYSTLFSEAVLTLDVTDDDDLLLLLSAADDVDAVSEVGATDTNTTGAFDNLQHNVKFVRDDEGLGGDTLMVSNTPSACGPSSTSASNLVAAADEGDDGGIDNLELLLGEMSDHDDEGYNNYSSDTESATTTAAISMVTAASQSTSQKQPSGIPSELLAAMGIGGGGGDADDHNNPHYDDPIALMDNEDDDAMLDELLMVDDNDAVVVVPTSTTALPKPVIPCAAVPSAAPPTTTTTPVSTAAAGDDLYAPSVAVSSGGVHKFAATTRGSGQLNNNGGSDDSGGRNYDDDAGDEMDTAPLPLAGRPVIVCPRSKLRYAPTHRRSVQQFLVNEFEVVTARQMPFREIATVNRAFLQSGPAGIVGAFTAVGVVVTKYYSKGGSSTSASTASGGGEYNGGGGGGGYGIIKVWDTRNTSLHVGTHANNPNILTVLVSGAAFQLVFARLMPGSVVILMNPQLSAKSGGGGGGYGGGGGGGNNPSSSSQQQMPMFKVSDFNAIMLAGRSLDCGPCNATTGAGGGFGGNNKGGRGSYSSSSNADTGKTCGVIVNKTLGDHCAYHSAGAAGRSLRSAVAAVRGGTTTPTATAQNGAASNSTITTHTTGTTTAKGLRLTMLPGSTIGSIGGSAVSARGVASIGGIGGGVSSMAAIAMRVAGAVGAGASANPLLRGGVGINSAAAASGGARNATITGGAGTAARPMTAPAGNTKGTMARPTTTTIATAAAPRPLSAAEQLRMSLQAQVTGILGIGGGSNTSSTAAKTPVPACSTGVSGLSIVTSSASSPKGSQGVGGSQQGSARLGTADATIDLLTKVGNADPRSDETSPRGRWREQQQRQQGYPSASSSIPNVTAPPAPRDNVLGPTENFICTKGLRLVNQTTMGVAVSASAAAAQAQLLRHRVEPTKPLTAHAIGLTHPPPSAAASSSDNARPQQPLPQHSRITSHMTGVGGVGGGISTTSTGGIGGGTHNNNNSGTNAAAAAAAADATSSCPRGRIMLAAAVDAQTKARMREQLEEAKRMSIVVAAASKRAREEGGSGSGDTAAGSVAGNVIAKLARPEVASSPSPNAHLVTISGGLSAVPSTFFVRKDASAATAAATLQQSILLKQRIANQKLEAVQAQQAQQQRQAAALGLPAGVRVLAPGQQPHSAATAQSSANALRPPSAFSSMAGSGGSATFTGHGAGSLGGAVGAQAVRRALVEGAGGVSSSFVANALAGGVDIVAMAKATTSKHAGVLREAEWDTTVKKVDQIVSVEKALEALEKVTEVPNVPCLHCADCDVYFASSGAGMASCRARGHAVTKATATKRFYECALCQQCRIQVLEPADGGLEGKRAGGATPVSTITMGGADTVTSNVKGGGSSGMGARRRLDRDCAVCKRLGFWRRCSAAPAKKMEPSLE